MDNESDINQQVGNMIGSQNSPVGASSRGSLNIPTRTFTTISALFDNINKQAERLEKRLPRLSNMLRDMARSTGQIDGGTGGSAGSGYTNGVAQALSTIDKRNIEANPERMAISRGAGMLAGGGVKGAAVSAGVSAALSAASTSINLMDRRIDQNANYALSADRMSVLYQQMTGMSQSQVQNTFRQPLTNYRLGAGGINNLLALQATTGINASMQAPSVEALRAISGYSLGTADVSNMIRSLASPATVNRMFATTGQSLYGFGGKQRSAMEVIQNLTSTAGLTNKAVVESAFQPGSVSRERLRQMGVPEEMVDTVLLYARQNISYKEKGGKGFYNPSEKEQRKLMGIEGNFATQAEETERVRGRRAEQFYSRQADNYASLERATQKLEQAFGALEDKLSGIIGARASTRPYQKIIGGIAKGFVKAGIGAAAGFFMSGLNPAGAVAGGIGGALNAVGDVAGDPMTTDGQDTTKVTSTTTPSGMPGVGANKSTPTTTPVGQIAGSERVSKLMVPIGYGNAERLVPYDKLSGTQQFSKLNPSFKSKLLKLIASSPTVTSESGELVSTVGVGSGYRSVDDQAKHFFARYERTDEKTGMFWDGRYWKRKAGATGGPFAPPGLSNHQIGHAADLLYNSKFSQRRGGWHDSFRWTLKNAARFGLVIPNSKKDAPHIETAGLAGTPYKGKAVWTGTRGIDFFKQGPGHGGTPTDKMLLADIRAGAMPLGALDPKMLTKQIVQSLVGGGVDPSEIQVDQIVKDLVGSGLIGQSGGNVNEAELATWLSQAITEAEIAPPIEDTTSSWSSSSRGSQPASGFALQQANRLGSSSSGSVGSYLGLSIDQIVSKVRSRVRTKFSTYNPLAEALGSGLEANNMGMGDANFASPSPPTLPPQNAFAGSSGGGGGVAVAYSKPVVYQISPTINIGNASGVSQSDLKQMAKEIGRLIEHEITINNLRRK